MTLLGNRFLEKGRRSGSLGFLQSSMMCKCRIRCYHMRRETIIIAATGVKYWEAGEAGRWVRLQRQVRGRWRVGVRLSVDCRAAVETRMVDGTGGEAVGG